MHLYLIQQLTDGGQLWKDQQNNFLSNSNSILKIVKYFNLLVVL